MSRPWLALVLILFCLPLFVGLRSLDLETDEAIYSFAVDRILADGEWMQPKSSPSHTVVFLEKPPLKFWIVAAPIKAGLLPDDEFGLRFWDALFGAMSFLYVFAIGSRLAGPICGAVAVLLLFLHGPLLFEHGLRTNNMEAPLFLCYCGGVYHFLQWAADTRRKTTHALATGVYFTLGFLTKFVAAAFLPLVLGLTVLAFRRLRMRILSERATWTAVGLVLALTVPWFAYAQWKFGSLLWETMLAEHVYARFTTALNQMHVQPWHYYLDSMWRALEPSGLRWLVPAGLVTLIVLSIRRRSVDGVLVSLWATIPIALISLGSSKLYHYAYPFLPPLMLAAGYLVALIVMLAPVVVRKLLDAIDDAITRMAPRWPRAASQPAVRALSGIVMGAAAIAVLWTAAFGDMRVAIGRSLVFKNTGAMRPMIALAAAGVLSRRSLQSAFMLVAMTLIWWTPIHAYRDTIPALRAEKHPLRDASACVSRVEQAMPPESRPGLFVDSDGSIWHPINFYFQRIQPWTEQRTPAPETLDRYLHDPASFRPSLVQDDRYHAYLRGPEEARFNRGISPPMIPMLDYTLLLPGPYRVCSPESRLQPVR